MNVYLLPAALASLVIASASTGYSAGSIGSTGLGHSASTPFTAAAATNATPRAPVVLPGRGLAQHPFLYGGEWDTRKAAQTIFVVRDGKVAWSCSIPTKDDKGELQELGDVAMLSNGHIVFTRKTGASEITPGKQIVWNYDAPKGCEVHSAQPVGLDRVLIMQNGKPARAMLIHKATGKVEKELVLKTGGTGAHGQFRHIRLTKAGTLLVAHLDLGKVVEYDWNGTELWSYAGCGPWSAWAAVRLTNGRTLISGNERGDVREVNQQGEVVWDFSQKDVPDIQLYLVQEADRLVNGNTVICNWCPSRLKPEAWPDSVQVLEVTPDKKVVWALRSWTEPADLGPATSIQLLDEPGVSEDGDLQR